MKSRQKLVFIGLDGMSWELTNKLIELGIFKNIGYMKSTGCHGKMLSTKPPVTPSAWASFATGKKPENTGIYEFILPKEKFGDGSFVSTKNINGKTFYESLTDSNYKCILINLPLSYPPRIKKTIVTSILSRGSNIIFPQELLEKYPIFKKYKIKADTKFANLKKYSAFIEELRAVERTRFEVGKTLFTKESWDFFFIHFFSTDTLMHELYHILIKKDLRGKEKKLQEQAFEFFRDIDSYVGWFMNKLECAILFVLSDHGFKQYEGLFFANTWLKKQGYLSYAYAVGNNKKIFSNKIIDMVGYFDNKIFNKILSAIYGMAKTFFGITYQASNNISPKSQAYCLRKRGIYLNKAGYYAEGVLNNEEYFSLRKKLLKELKDLKGPDNKRAFKAVLTKEQIYGKNPINIAPDIYIDADKLDVIYHNSPHIFNTNITVNEHADYGIFLAYGTNVKKMQKDVAIWDFAPTILDWYGIKSAGQQFDGKSLDIFQSMPSKNKNSLEKIKLNFSINDLKV
ncbi:alkaline phosphatase family protein [Candidatus Woesearchaeota archaeon]|nr:alkaline phosphatase family protein [Candidatus Woesearchaeota archaeon]